jgi:hypothetical protein
MQNKKIKMRNKENVQIDIVPLREKKIWKFGWAKLVSDD